MVILQHKYLVIYELTNMQDDKDQFTFQRSLGCWTWKAKRSGKRGATRKDSPKKSQWKLTSHWRTNWRLDTLRHLQQTFKLFRANPPRTFYQKKSVSCLIQKIFSIGLHHSRMCQNTSNLNSWYLDIKGLKQVFRVCWLVYLHITYIRMSEINLNSRH